MMLNVIEMSNLLHHMVTVTLTNKTKATEIVFQQDEASLYYARPVREFLNDRYKTVDG